MKVPFVDLVAQYESIRESIDAAIADVIQHSAYIRGPNVDRFELAWAETVGCRHCVSCANGTDALYIAMKALGVSPGDEVITTAHSWIASSETVTQAGGRVVFCDTNPATFTMDPASVEERITPHTVGILPVHLYGQACDMDAIMAIAKKHSLWVVEDCAQAHLAQYRGRTVGSFGDFGTFSFYPGKNLGAYGDAGCLVSNETRLAEWAATYARHGGKGDHVMEGINSRMDGLQAAVLLAKLPHLASWTEARQRIAATYDRLLAEVEGVTVPVVGPDRTHVYHLYVIRTDNRDALRDHLRAAEVATGLHYPKILPLYPAYQYLGHKSDDFPAAFDNQSRILSLPMYPELPDESLAFVADRIASFAATHTST